MQGPSGVAMVAVPLRVDADAGVTPTAVSPAKVPRMTSRATTTALMLLAPGARVLPDPASGLCVASALDVFMVPFFRSCLSAVGLRWPAQELPVVVVDPQLPSAEVRLSNPNW